jgi:membrane associated rhomboid family serine protease
MDSQPTRQIPWCTYIVTTLLILTGAASIHDFQANAQRFGFIPAHAWRDYGETFFTCFFLHAGIIHLAGNLYFLVVFGRQVEDYLGRWRWLVLLAAATVLGNLGQLLFDPNQTLPSIGASGGISGLLAFYVLRFPHAQLGIFLGRFLMYRWIRLPAWSAFLFWIAFQFYGAYQQLQHVGSVDSLAHLGGCLAGVAGWWAWRKIDAVRSPIPFSPIRVIRQ